MSAAAPRRPLLPALPCAALPGLVALALLSGCQDDPCQGGDPLPERWTLSAPGITVEVQRDPYGFTVRDGAGAAVLSTLGAGHGDGYGAVGLATGQVFIDKQVDPGYFSFQNALDPWQDGWRVGQAAQAGPSALDVTLAPSSTGAGAGRCMRVTHKLRGPALRVEAQLDGEGAGPRAWAAAFHSPRDEAFLGFGERFNCTDQRGLNLYSFAEEGGLSQGLKARAGPTNPWPNGETMTYYPVPFFVSSKGYGFWLDSTWRNEFNLATDQADAWRVWHIGPRLAYEVYVPPGPAAPSDRRPWPYQLIDQFTAATGRPMVPPPWSLGPRRRINRGAMHNGVPEIQAMRDLRLPITSVDDALHFLPAGSDIGHEDEIRAWVADSRKRGCRVIGYYNPYLAKAPGPLSEKVQQALQRGWFLHDAQGKPSEVWLISGAPLSVYTVDLTSADATAWFQSLFQRALSLGYSGWMYDFGEYVQADVVTASGLSGEEFHNLFPVLYQKAAFDALEAGPWKGDWYTFVRSGYTGASRYSPAAWSGDPDASFSDAEGLPAMSRAGINIGISGVPNWGSDIGGFKCLADGAGAADGELLARWIQLGAMSPNMHDEDSCSGGTSGQKATIWSAPEAQAAWRTYARLHTRLLPYFYTLATEANRSGAPVIRHVFLEHPDRPDLAGVDDTFYLGPALLVAPVLVRGARERQVDLPAGLYLDWQAETLLSGPGKVTVGAPLDKLPLLLRDGQLLPLLDPAIDTLSDDDHPGVVGPREVAGVYDVVGLLSTRGRQARFVLWDGGTLQAAWSGGFAPPDLPAAGSPADLVACAGCWLRQQLQPGLSRVRISTTAASVSAGGLTLAAQVGRRLRWDLYLVE